MKKIYIGLMSIIGIFIIGLACLSIMKHPNTILTDSGWDSDYDSGSWDSGSWDSGYDTGSSWDSDYSYSGSSSSGGSYGSFSTLMLVLLIVIVVVATSSKKKSYNGGYHNPNAKFYEHAIGDADKEIQKYLPNMTEKQLLNTLYNKFIEIQNAWMNFDYDILKKDCTDELYNSYQADLEILKSKDGQNIMHSFKCINYNINGIVEENGILTIKMYLHVEFYDYVIDTNTNEIIRGNNNSKVHNQYHLNFISKKTNEEIICPSCGAKVEKGLSECTYCHTVINNNYDDFVLSSKSKI